VCLLFGVVVATGSVDNPTLWESFKRIIDCPWNVVRETKTCPSVGSADSAIFDISVQIQPGVPSVRHLTEFGSSQIDSDWRGSSIWHNQDVLIKHPTAIEFMTAVVGLIRLILVAGRMSKPTNGIAESYPEIHFRDVSYSSPAIRNVGSKPHDQIVGGILQVQFRIAHCYGKPSAFGCGNMVGLFAGGFSSILSGIGICSCSTSQDLQFNSMLFQMMRLPTQKVSLNRAY